MRPFLHCGLRIETGLPATIGLVCAPPLQNDVIRLLSGEPLQSAVEQVSDLGPVAILVNCAAPHVIAAALRELRLHTSLPTGGYANVGAIDDVTGWSPDESMTGENYANTQVNGWTPAQGLLVGAGDDPEAYTGPSAFD